MEEHQEHREDPKTYNFAYEILVSVSLIYNYENRSKRCVPIFKFKKKTIFFMVSFIIF